MLGGESGQRERQWSRFPPGQSASGVVVGPLGVVVGAGPEILGNFSENQGSLPVNIRWLQGS